MEVLEIITLRSLEPGPEALAEEILGSLGAAGPRVELYRHVAVGTDLSIHLHWETENGGEHRSDLGLRLVEALREHGRVSHSIWKAVPRLSSAASERLRVPEDNKHPQRP